MRRMPRHRRSSTSMHLMEGFTDGTLATLPMSAFMLLAQRAGAMGRQPPAKIAEAAMNAAARSEPPSPVKKAASTILHFGFGGTAGAAFSAWARRQGRPPRVVRDTTRGALGGAAFGSLVWALSYMGWVPALGIMPPPHRDRPGRPWSMIVAHWIYGATLGWRTAARSA